MRLLVSNDDGVLAPGIIALAAALRELGAVTVMAPDRDRSGASNSLTLGQPLRVHELEPNRYSVTGTPTDCVHLALGGFLQAMPDIVVSGINNSANMGDDTLYSGTVAAAMEGRNLGLPAVAVSLCSLDHQGDHFASAARAAVAVVRRLAQDKLPSDTLLNVNVPDLPWAEIKGFEVTRLGMRHRGEPSIRQLDPRGRPIYWVGPAGREADGGPGTDFDAVRRGFVSITPITMDLTRYSAMDTVKRWVGTL
jgi:5'-nucleotidase